MIRKITHKYTPYLMDTGHDMIIYPVGHTFYLYQCNEIYLTQFMVDVFCDADNKVHHVPVYFLVGPNDELSPRDVLLQMNGIIPLFYEADRDDTIRHMVRNELLFVFQSCPNELLAGDLAFTYLLFVMDTYNALKKIPDAYRERLAENICNWTNRHLIQSRTWNLAKLRREST